MTRVTRAMRRFLLLSGLPLVAANTCTGTPHVGPMQDASSCSGLAHCGECQVQCSCQGLGNNCLGSDTLLRCLGHEDPIRNLSKDQFQYGTCNSADTSAVGLVAADPCGYELCCPASPFVPSGCNNAIEQRLGMEGQCQAMIASGTYSCEASFCPSCGPLAGQCDQYCGYGACAVCGDCWPSARTAAFGRARCDDGNSQDGDGCSSTCEVEDGWTCTREVVPIMNTALNIQTIIEVDRCRKCTDSPVGWTDLQGYTCQDYEFFQACDAGSSSTDPLVAGGRVRVTPEYFQYQFLYDLNITMSQPLMMIVTVTAASNAHIFLGKPQEYGFEIVLGGWNNGLSVLRVYPTAVQLDNKYDAVLDAGSPRSFWIYYSSDGNLSVGIGEVFWNQSILHGSYLSMHEVQNYGWVDASNTSLLNQVHITTGWSSTGLWDVRLVQGFAGLTIQDLANGGIDATSACCACSGGVFGRPCEQRTTGALPWVARGDVKTQSRRLAGGFQDAILLGAPSVDGFALSIQFVDCEAASGCMLDAIVLPSEAKDKVLTPLRQVWTQVIYPGCRTFDHAQVGSYYIWRTSDCNFTAGTLYALALHLTTTGGDYLHIMDLQVPGLPASEVTALSFKDLDVRGGYMRGEVSIEGLEDESNVLQYRTYFGQAEGTKIGFISDERAAKIGWINTFASGGLRSGFNNECLYGDCNWNMHLARSAQNGRAVPQYIIRHKNTGYCLCYPFQELTETACPTELLTLDAPVTYKYTPTGNGALLDRNDDYYKTVWYRDIGDRSVRTFDSVKAIMEQVCNDMLPCVGILILDPGYDGILLLDRRYGTSEYPGQWPPELHPALQAIGAEQAWEAYSDSQALAPANPSRTSLDIINDPFWQPWRAYIREVQEDCLWMLQDRIFNGTVESRLMSSAAHDCLCQVPAESDTVGPDGLLVPAQDTMWHQPLVGKFCDAMVLDFRINDKEVRTTGYCEWELHPSVPSDFVVGLDATMNDSVTTSGAVEWTIFEGVESWQLTGSGALPIPDTILASNYTLAAWVNIPSFDFLNASDAAVISIFNSLGLSGREEPCLQVSQRAQLDGRPAFCGGDFLCNASQVDCCYFGYGTSTTTTTTSTAGNNTMEDEQCGCSCAISMTEEVANELGQPLPGNKWALQMRACDSEVPWDSGTDITVQGGSSNWLLLVAAADSETTTFYTSQALAPEVVTYNQSFGCDSPGCRSTVIFRDIPRDPSRTCALEVDVWVTDYTNNEHHATPEVVEVITVRGGAPVNSRDVRRYCHPGAANQLNWLYNCVHKENLDEWVLSTSADRAIRIELKISDYVDAYPKDGMYLSGFAAISCAQVMPPARGLPKSGSLHALGSVKRSCSGSTLKAVGGATGSTAAGDAPSIYISQAWAFQRMLPMDELMALHLGTRTRYHRDYQIPVTTEIVKPGVEVVVSGILQCEFPGCSASVTLTGLPTNGDAQCFLTFKVRITDFSGPEEVVEYIRIDNDVQNVVENCWPQADGNPDAYYFCADSLDISQSVLRSSFLRDSEAVITAKISEDVDILDFRYQNRWMLYAEAEIRCLGGADKELQATVQVQPEVTHILAAAINAQGEGPMRSTPFVDSSNGFTEPPMILLASTAALQVSVQSAFPGQFWAFVTYRVDDAITIQDIYSGAYSSKAICEAPHRARGQLTIQDFRGDPFLVNCEFEPGIPYTLIVYIDALEAPWGGGEVVKLPFTGVMPDTPTNLPLVRARAMSFLDTNPLAAKVYGTLTITSAASEQNLTHYHLYYGSFGRIWPEGSEPFAIIPATGAYEYSVLVNAQLLPGANTFLVFCKNSYGESTLERRLGILDSSMILLQDPAITPSYNNGNLYLEVSTQMSGPGARVDVAVVPGGVEVDARSTLNYRELDFGPISARTVCTERDIQYDLTSGSKVIGPCYMDPNKAYTVIVHVAIRYDCPCEDPCYCTGEMSFDSQAPGAGLDAANGRIILPDTVPPNLVLYPCDSTCNLDSKLRLTGHVSDPGNSYPVVTMCAACVPPYDPNNDPTPQALDPPRTCLRNGDSVPHRYWRLRIPQGEACLGKTTINILEAEFYQVSPLERTGRLVTPAAILAKVPEIAGANKAAAFDGSQASMYLMDTQFDAWLGVDVGIGNQEAMLRVRAFWESGCVPSKLVLEWSDDIITWTERMTTMPDTSQTMTDVYVDAGAVNWTSGAFYQVAFTAESEKNVLIEGVTPGSAYHIHCWSVDSANTEGAQQQALAVTTVDFVSPFMTVSDLSAADYTARVHLDLQDPGKAYPALSTCVARELTGQSEALPAIHELSSRGQKCQYLEVTDRQNADGRIMMSDVFSARMLDRKLLIQQSAWGGHRQDYQSCGFNHQPMAQAGGCTARDSKQKVSFVVTVKSPRDLYLFIGPRNGEGYEILLGGWQNTRVTLGRGHSRNISNEGQAPPTVVVSWSTADNVPILDPGRFKTFWVDADPMTGLIRVGMDEIFGHHTLISYNDSAPISPLTSLLVGTQAPGNPAELYICPRVGNLLQGRSISSSSVAFHGVPEKAVDGQWGDNTFCEYCAQNDPLHVCASTRRQDTFSPPNFRISLGERLYLIKAVRLVVPTDGRPEQSAEWSVFVGNTGFRSDGLCTTIPDARGDNLWPCNPAQGNWLSVWGNVNQLKVLPEEFGIRICEIEAYADLQNNNRLEDITDQFNLNNGLPTPLVPDGGPQPIDIYGLQPNRDYEVFCYSEDLYGNLQYSLTSPLTVHTTDTTAPKLRINHIYPNDLSITVEVGLEDPGDAYPALARCMATTKEGRAPQEHDAYFEHRFWRIRFITTYTNVDPSCDGRVLLRSLDLQSWGGETFRREMFSSDPARPQDTIGLDTDDNNLIDSFEIAAWSVPVQDAWVGIDLQHMPETAARVKSRGFLLEGDLTVAIRWEGNVEELDLSVLGPGTEYLEFNLTEGDFYRVSDGGTYAVPCNPGDGCNSPIRSTLFVLALAGDYDITVYRRTEPPWSEMTIQLDVKRCGFEQSYPVVLSADEQNETIRSGVRVAFQGCHRKPQAAVANLRVWQSTVAGGGASENRMWYLADDDPNSCMETGGIGSDTADAKPWWRVSLERTQLLQGIWLAGQGGPGIATHADVFTSPSIQQDVSAVVDLDSYNGQIFYIYNASTQYCYRVTIGQLIEEDRQSSASACDALGFTSTGTAQYYLIGSYTSTTNNEQSFENGVTCDRVAGQRHARLSTAIRTDDGALEVTIREVRPCSYEAILHVPLSNILQHGTLCAEDVPIGVLQDPFQVPATRACFQESRGSTVWVVAKYGRLRLCEVELFTEPLPTVTQVSFDYGASGNESVGAVCGANNISIEFSDDNVSWMKAWDAFADGSVFQHVQFARWSWWQRLFALPFHTNFSQAESRNVTIPSLRENSSYDVLCWATDAIGNDIMQSMVMLPLPWADTRKNVITAPVDYPGVRRLQDSQEDNETWKCESWIRELMVCEEEVATSDRVIPRVVQALLVEVQSTTEGFFTGNTERASFRLELRDGSCNNRLEGSGTECHVICRVLEQDLSWLTAPSWSGGSSCLYPRCDEKAWSNEYPVYLSFGMLQPGQDYTVVCYITDPWANQATQEFTLSIPAKTTQAPQSTEPRSTQGPLTPPPVTQPPITAPRTTQAPEYYTRAPTVRTTAWASTTGPGPGHGGHGGGFSSTSRSWAQRSTEQTTTVEATVPQATLPPWLETYTPTGPMKNEMTLSTSSREDAEAMQMPSAISALRSALRTSLQLGPLDELTIQGVEIYSEGTSGRRLSVRWLVRVKFTVEAYNAVQNKALVQRVGELGLADSAVSSSFQEELSTQLAQRGSSTEVGFVGSTPLQDGAQWSPVPAPPSPAGATTSIAGAGPGAGPGAIEEPDGDSNLGLIIPLAIAIVCACMGLLVGGAIYAIYSARPPNSPQGKLSKVANSNQALTSAESNPALFVPRTPSGRALLPDLRETAKAELHSVESMEEPHRKFRHSPAASSARSGGREAHVVNVR